MQYMFIMRSTDEAAKASKDVPVEEMINRMGAYNESMIDAGVLLAGEGLAEATQDNAFVVDFTEDPPLVTDGSYGETHALFNGFWIIQAASKEEAAEWAMRCPLGPGSKLEVRRITDAGDFAEFADNEYIRKEEGWRDTEAKLRSGNA